MRKYKLLALFASILVLANEASAQLPNNIPTNNLEVYYSFVNSANDYFNNCNGVVSGASASSDANGNPNSAYSFNGSTDFINIPAEFVNGQTLSSQTFRVKFKINQSGSYTLWNKDGSWQETAIYIEPDNSIGLFWAFPNYYSDIRTNSGSIQLGVWNDVFIIVSNNSASVFINGVQQSSYQVNSVTSSNISYSHSGSCGTQYGNNRFGFVKISCNPNKYHMGEIDEFGLWSRALTNNEITNISLPCSQSFTLQPSNQYVTIGTNALFTALSSEPTATYQWQSNPLNFGWSNIPNNQNYSGATTNSLSVINVNLSNHNQTFRVIATSGNCIDTSNVAVINILDTCISNITVNDTVTTQVFDTTYVTQTIYDTLQVTIYDTLQVTVYDTLLTTVTDTLVINTQITGINPPNNMNTLKVFPNPASTHITIDYGNFNAMNGYTLKIVNALGQTVFTTPINQQTSYIDLSTWTGNGIYFVQLIDPQNNTIENRKIVIQ